MILGRVFGLVAPEHQSILSIRFYRVVFDGKYYIWCQSFISSREFNIGGHSSLQLTIIMKYDFNYYTHDLTGWCGRIRTFERIPGQIYSLLPLTPQPRPN